MTEQILSPHGDGVRQLTYRVVPIVPVLFDFEPEMDWGYRFCKHPVLIDGRHIEMPCSKQRFPEGSVQIMEQQDNLR